MTPAAQFLERLRQAAESASAKESVYRREAGARIACLERERAFAFRRANLMRAIGEAARGSLEDPLGEPGQAAEEAEEMATARALFTLRARLAWPADSEFRSAVLARFAPLAVAMVRASWPSGNAGQAGAEDEIAGALDAFERWYEETCRVSFWALFENEMPETPRVDF
jgi:hypothetical protein